MFMYMIEARQALASSPGLSAYDINDVIELRMVVANAPREITRLLTKQILRIAGCELQDRWWGGTAAVAK